MDIVRSYQCHANCYITDGNYTVLLGVMKNGGMLARSDDVAVFTGCLP
jgi:hypothetical protein